MAITVPIITQFDQKGIKLAERRFKQFGRDASKVGDSIKAAMLPAAAAVGALAVAGISAVKAAIEDEAAQKALERQIRRTTKATDAQIAANEDWIKTQGKLLGVADDELRPALAGLVRATGSITKAQKAASLAMDISAAKGVSLETVTKALERAYGGNLNALAKLSPEVRAMIKDGASLEEVMASLSKTFEDEASDAANTTAGKFKTLKNSFNEAKEELGVLLIPAMEDLVKLIQEKVIPYMEKLIEKFKEDGLSGAIKMATSDLGKFISKLEGWKGTVFNFAAALGIMYAGFKLFTFVGGITSLVGSFAGVLSSLGGYLGYGFAVSAGFAAAALGLIFVNLMVLIDALRDNEFRPVFLAYLLNTGKLIANVFVFIHNTLVDIINLLPRLVNAVLPGDPVGLVPRSDYFEYDYSRGRGDSMPSTPTARRRSVDESGGVTVNFNGVVTDPVAVGLEIRRLLGSSDRRIGAM
jgi:hypothetical protein